MDATYQQLADYLWKLHESDPSKQYFIGVAGSPGSGKTTTTAEIAKRVNRRAEKEICVILPMDGFHYYRSELAAMPNSTEAFQRRGAHWTFNVEKFCACVHSIKATGHGTAPSFDHGFGDPVEDDIRIEASHNIVLVEGNYLYLDLPGWREVFNELDEKWFLEADEDMAMERVVKRHMGTGNTEDLARLRVESNDRKNAQEINATKFRASKVIASVQDSSVGV